MLQEDHVVVDVDSKRARQRAATARWRSRNLELCRKRDRERYANNVLGERKRTLDRYHECAEVPGFRERMRQKAKRWYSKPENSTRLRRWQQAQNHRTTPEILDAIWESQGRQCAICKLPLARLDKRSHVDHDHNTGAIRGFLCYECNRGIGAFKDNHETLQRAIEYLLKERERGSSMMTELPAVR